METYFDDLPLKLKSKILSEFASPLISIEHYDHRIGLYTLSTLLIEQHEAIQTGEIEKIIVADYHSLDKYLPWIMIGDIKKRLRT